MKLSILKTKIKTVTIALLSATTLLFSHAVLAVNHSIEITAKSLPNGQPAFQMQNHTINGGVGIPTDQATIPGPTLFFTQGDKATINIKNDTAKNIDFNIGIGAGASVPIAPGATGTVNINANQIKAGTYAYSDINSALLGLFGAIVVDNLGSSIQSYVDADGTITKVNSRDDLDKEFVMFMVGSTFWGTEIKGSTQTPLWTNPDWEQKKTRLSGSMCSQSDKVSSIIPSIYMHIDGSKIRLL